MTNDQMNDLADKISKLTLNAINAAPNLAPTDIAQLVFVNAKAAISEAAEQDLMARAKHDEQVVLWPSANQKANLLALICESSYTLEKQVREAQTPEALQEVGERLSDLPALLTRRG